MSAFESHWRAGMTGLEVKLHVDQREEAIELVKNAIEAGVFNDLGSGSNVDVVVITNESTDVLRNYRKPNERATKELSYKFARGTTAILKSDIRSYWRLLKGMQWTCLEFKWVQVLPDLK
ncbi:hypothetical protein BJ742DRAFT_745529 [Cladochytrium replicatum]|nr:hypothetical protein BJ742DRAFT_745529 [Cladochytrium replicatum]